MTEADLQKRVAETFHAICHKMNGHYAYQAMTAEQPDALDRQRETRELLCELRDTTQSKSIYDRTVAIVGERGQ